MAEQKKSNLTLAATINPKVIVEGLQIEPETFMHKLMLAHKDMLDLTSHFEAIGSIFPADQISADLVEVFGNEPFIENIKDHLKKDLKNDLQTDTDFLTESINIADQDTFESIISNEEVFSRIMNYIFNQWDKEAKEGSMLALIMKNIKEWSQEQE